MIFEASRLRIIRTSQAEKYSQADIAEVLGMQQSGYSKIERGEVSPTIIQLTSLAEHYKIDLLDFFVFKDGEKIEEGLKKMLREKEALIQRLAGKIEGLERSLAIALTNRLNPYDGDYHQETDKSTR